MRLLWRGAGRRDRRITLSGQRASPGARSAPDTDPDGHPLPILN